MSEVQKDGVEKDGAETGNTDQDLSEILRIRRDKLYALKAAGQDPFLNTVSARDHTAAKIQRDFDRLEGKDVVIAGRVMSFRVMGKASFIDVADRTGRIQAYVRTDDVGEEEYTAFKRWDVGDIAEVRGYVFRTNRGEVSVHAKAVRLLAKSLQPLPEKWHGLKDTDLRYRQRYLDLIVNPEVRATFVRRSQILRFIRSFLDGHGFLEVETPTLNLVAGGASARPFVTHHNTLDLDMYLRIALELPLKRLIVGGMEKVYEMGRVFRNEGMSVKHNPEFTMLELYEAYTDYNGMMKLTEEMVSSLTYELYGTGHIDYQGQTIRIGAPWQKISMLEAVKSVTGVDFDSFRGDTEKARFEARQLGLPVQKNDTWGDLLNLFFEEKVESTLIQPTFVMDYPVEISPLTKKKPGRPDLTERFELFITGREYANAYTELNDPIDQRERFVRQMRLKDLGAEEVYLPDEDFLTAMEYGMPPTGGLGIGIDRLVMLLTDSASIRDVLLFPTMKPVDHTPPPAK